MTRLPDGARFATRAVHAGLDPDPAYGSVIPPIHQTSTYVQAAPGEFVEDYDYARSANPTRTALERALGELEGGLASCFASGMAATHALLTAHCGAGDHVVLPRDLYGGTYRLVDKVLAPWGVEYTPVDLGDIGIDDDFLPTAVVGIIERIISTRCRKSSPTPRRTSRTRTCSRWASAPTCPSSAAR